MHAGRDTIMLYIFILGKYTGLMLIINKNTSADSRLDVTDDNVIPTFACVHLFLRRSVVLTVSHYKMWMADFLSDMIHCVTVNKIC